MGGAKLDFVSATIKAPNINEPWFEKPNCGKKQNGFILYNSSRCKLTSISGVGSGQMVKGWDLWSRDPGSIPSAGSQFWFSCGVRFILARSLRNGTKNTRCPLCVRTPHTQSNVLHQWALKTWQLNSACLKTSVVRWKLSLWTHKLNLRNGHISEMGINETAFTICQ